LTSKSYYKCIGLQEDGNSCAGVLQADNVQPTHNKQDFERTSLFQKLELRLKDMTWEYWYSVYASVHGLPKYLYSCLPATMAFEFPLL